MRRAVEAGPNSARTQNRLDQRARRTFALRAGNVHDREAVQLRHRNAGLFQKSSGIGFARVVRLMDLRSGHCECAEIGLQLVEGFHGILMVKANLSEATHFNTYSPLLTSYDRLG